MIDEVIMLEQTILTLWPQLVALVLIAWLIARLSEKIHQAELKITTLFDLVNRLREEQYKDRK